MHKPYSLDNILIGLAQQKLHRNERNWIFLILSEWFKYTKYGKAFFEWRLTYICFFRKSDSLGIATFDSLFQYDFWLEQFAVIESLPQENLFAVVIRLCYPYQFRGRSPPPPHLSSPCVTRRYSHLRPFVMESWNRSRASISAVRSSWPTSGSSLCLCSGSSRWVCVRQENAQQRHKCTVFYGRHTASAERGSADL